MKIEAGAIEEIVHFPASDEAHCISSPLSRSKHGWVGGQEPGTGRGFATLLPKMNGSVPSLAYTSQTCSPHYNDLDPIGSSSGSGFDVLISLQESPDGTTK